jgi:bifunctional UDP-N-acetylglucosamine pyrophosphorylase/glucosamine-1-phosphate N-acetyltransferase
MKSSTGSCGFATIIPTAGERTRSHTALVAPVTIGDGAYIATGSVVTADVPADALSIARARQVDRPGRAKALRDKLKAKKS